MKTPSVSDFKSQRYLVDRLLVANKLVWLQGFPGISKSLVALEIAARLTRGKSPGSMANDPCNVVYISQEGTFEEEIGPRFMAAKGDFERFEHLYEIIDLPGEEDAGLDRLSALIDEHQARLLVIDPIKDHVAGIVYSSPTRASKFFGKLAALAVEKECTILCVDWPSKAVKKNDFLASGPTSVTGKLRQAVDVGRLSVDEWVAGITKANNSNVFVGWIYTLEVVDLGPDADGDHVRSARIRWVREADRGEIQKARQQAALGEDKHLRELLQFMNAPEMTEGADGKPKAKLDEKGNGVMTSFVTIDLVNWLNNARGVGQKKARAMITAAGDAGYLVSTTNLEQGAGYGVTWRITPLGVMRLRASDDEVEAALATIFPSMDHDPLLVQPALGPAREEI
jgi:hypothetical protein